VRFGVLIDGKPPGAAHGIDVDDQGNGTVAGQRLYQLIRQPPARLPRADGDPGTRRCIDPPETGM
jgi:thioredoxin family protein